MYIGTLLSTINFGDISIFYVFGHGLNGKGNCQKVDP